MNPQLDNNAPSDPNQPAQPVQPSWPQEPAPTPAPVSPEPQSPPFVPFPEPKKRSKKGLVLGVVAALVLLSVGAYVAYALLQSNTHQDTTTLPVVVPADDTKTGNAELDAATDTLNNGTATETTVVTTDDSNSVSGTDSDAAKVEESIDENNF